MNNEVIPTQAEGQFRVRPSQAVQDAFVVANRETGSDSYIDPNGSSGSSASHYKTQALAQAALDKYLRSEFIDSCLHWLATCRWRIKGANVKCEICTKIMEPDCDKCSAWSDKDGCISTSPTLCPHYKPCDCQKEVPYDKLVVGRKYRIVMNDGSQVPCSTWLDGEYIIDDIEDHGGSPHFFVSGLRARAYKISWRKFYETNQETEVTEKEQDMASKQITLFTTAIVVRAKPIDDGVLGRITGLKKGSMEVDSAIDVAEAIAARVDGTEPLKTHDVVGTETVWHTLC